MKFLRFILTLVLSPIVLLILIVFNCANIILPMYGQGIFNSIYKELWNNLTFQEIKLDI
jgi:hypothetical protein